MGCSSSKKNQDVAIPGEIEAPVQPEELNMNEVKKYLNDLYNTKELYNQSLLESYGLDSLLEKCREQLIELATTQQKSKDNYEFLLNYAMERDSDDVYRALQASNVDKRVLIDILTARPKWQLDRISELYEKKHKTPLIAEIQKQLKKFTGSQSDLGKLLLNVCMEQPQRDSYLLNTHLKELDIVIEIIATRTNRELRDAMIAYRTAYNKEFSEVIKSKSYKNFGKMICRILECKRSESTEPYSHEVVQALVEELHLASSKKDADAYIRIFADISFSEFQSLSKGYAAQYGDIIGELKKFSGDFYNLLLARCSDKYDYLCYRLHLEGAVAIPRILGCMKRKECKEFAAIFDSNKDQFGNGKTLIEFLEDLISKESYLAACINLISNDTSYFPLGVDRELGEDEILISSQGEAAEKLLHDEYTPSDIRNEGESYLERNPALEILENTKTKPPKLNTKKQIGEYITHINEEIYELRKLTNEVNAEIDHKKDLYFTMRRHNIEVEEWRQLYDVYSEMLNKHIAVKDRNAAATMNKK